ncbi:hypothetical protein GQ600_7626 [Phytophthora cactorum]|nr:hypothetical protein GQ600_7626 [Phytophthora cactorum]
MESGDEDEFFVDEEAAYRRLISATVSRHDQLYRSSNTPGMCTCRQPRRAILLIPTEEMWVAIAAKSNDISSNFGAKLPMKSWLVSVD